MKKKQHKPTTKKDDSSLTLKDMINPDLIKKLKDQQNELKVEEEKRKEQEEQRKREERRLKEKNKSFEELLNESSMNWKEFK
ncbi:YqkE family protein [Neobacillus mesonae]|uniref:YqkE family protein n=1 Tax=Neobacillus mesonae TaxID=1193713 RepID=UPI00203EE51B|nr:YqkE family protein [Neobacillus mesonae]MCM3566713.1 YqkE family protein [Neobacillus mesonae]